MWVMFHHVCVWPVSSCFLNITPSIISSDVQLLYTYITCLDGGSLFDRSVYIFFFLHAHILPNQFLLRITLFFQDLMKYHIKICKGYCIDLFILQHRFFVNAFLYQGYHKQYYPFYNLYPWIRHGCYLVQAIPLSHFTIEYAQKITDDIWSNTTLFLTIWSPVILLICL